MPDSDHWSASMLLHWVLIRDREAVLSMLAHYGGVVVNGDNVTPIRPRTWDDVARDYAIEDSLPVEERVAGAVLKSELEIIPAETEIYRALSGGEELYGWARPNGSGDFAKIEGIQWAGLRFRAIDGHDIAVPVDSEGNPLPLPRPLADYLSGLVPATSVPTVWPDPLFPAEQAMRLWPPRVVVQGSLAPPPRSIQPLPNVDPQRTTKFISTPSTETPHSTASYDDVKAAVRTHGPATEGKLLRSVREALPGKHVPREWVRKARRQLFGSPKIGRPRRET